MEQYEDSMIRREQSREAHPAWPNSPMGVPAGRSNLGLVSRRITTSPVFDASRQKNQIITSDSLFCWYSLGDRYSIGYSATWIGKAECLTLPGPSYHELRSSHDIPIDLSTPGEQTRRGAASLLVYRPRSFSPVLPGIRDTLSSTSIARSFAKDHAMLSMNLPPSSALPFTTITIHHARLVKDSDSRFVASLVWQSGHDPKYHGIHGYMGYQYYLLERLQPILIGLNHMMTLLCPAMDDSALSAYYATATIR
ncbi:uncharacterized protein BO96DRAFT_430613 [Aspergillus niger CBS 101883]|uniref:Uncharacterized protein n=2 Tax=Aspergillus niger TaxID=5061 RepID=A2QPJ0_ASPNC|nr:uncharacterized protein BO96DRAFT_430613 [Aspergillus niger CBS 101883]XP_059601097.1 hypothetical protein An07g09620 [Aspergillus niger]PYH60691.1 hypothetical protein BO96DRAFT_430613 [Aspergillus niger CBS 101883]CAK39727.1 hypothetical protein An07g09620 [Aspergillus niger]